MAHSDPHTHTDIHADTHADFHHEPSPQAAPPHGPPDPRPHLTLPLDPADQAATSHGEEPAGLASSRLSVRRKVMHGQVSEGGRAAGRCSDGVCPSTRLGPGWWVLG